MMKKRETHEAKNNTIQPPIKAIINNMSDKKSDINKHHQCSV